MAAKKAMTEKRWETCSNPGPMLEYLRGRASQRKLRLFAVACCRGILSKRDHYHAALDTAEKVAEGNASRELVRDLDEWDGMAMGAGDPTGWAIHHATNLPEEGLDHEFTNWVAGMRPGGKEVNSTEDLARFADLLRCLFGNPFRRAAVEHAWQTRTVVTLAKQMYDKKTFDAMPILADALQDAGCTNEEMLSHCRGAGPHVRGCWVVDLLLGKE